jgi:hypothetical protein
VRLDSQEFSNYENLKTALTTLEKNQPGCYAGKLQAAETAYEQIIRNSNPKPLPKQHQW